MKRWLPTLRTYAAITLACVIYAVAYNVFYAPNNIAFGGVTGIAQMINRLFGVPSVGVLIIVINIPLFIAAWRLLGGKMLLGSLYTMTVSSLLLDLFGNFIHMPSLTEPLMACFFGGVVMGASMGLVAREGASFGGSDIAARLVRLKIPTMSIGKLLLGIDLVVITGVSIVFRQLDPALMGILALTVSSTAMDKVLFGADPSKVAYIISDHSTEIAEAIITKMHRGVTLLHGAGAWSGEKKNVILCAFKNRQVVELKRMIQEIDPRAFLIVCDAYEVLGDGFLSHEAQRPPAKPLIQTKTDPVTGEPLYKRAGRKMWR